MFTPCVTTPCVTSRPVWQNHEVPNHLLIKFVTQAIQKFGKSDIFQTRGRAFDGRTKCHGQQFSILIYFTAPSRFKIADRPSAAAVVPSPAVVAASSTTLSRLTAASTSPTSSAAVAKQAANLQSQIQLQQTKNSQKNIKGIYSLIENRWTSPTLFNICAFQKIKRQCAWSTS